ncbi:hypothetical protein PFNF54_00790 [Plasmodium falciparum NF54]|uniref:Uncharacterized protein n=1 Tax=Plasmodium falciparum (isolate NF54) TaxID=5843 RepID=W7KBJ2_PLAFO|nr:hypothetical protein PFNF54_00790 [Plasmodium falciparum NF54]
MNYFSKYKVIESNRLLYTSNVKYDNYFININKKNQVKNKNESYSFIKLLFRKCIIFFIIYFLFIIPLVSTQNYT